METSEVCGAASRRGMRLRPPKFFFLGVLLLSLSSLSACAGLPDAGSSNTQKHTNAGLSPYQETVAQSDNAPSKSVNGEEDLPLDILDNPLKAEPSASHAQFDHDLTEYWLKYSGCMEDRGWPEQEVEDPHTSLVAIRLDGWFGRVEAFTADTRACFEQLGPAPQGPEPSVNSADELYDSYVAFHQCFTAKGYSLSDPPSRTVFRDDVLAERIPWIPYAEAMEIPDIRINGMRALYDMCPW
ncbi:hypothetical protein [Schaalia sp. Marseille-Q2122]|uniref:hypothetical protein n=1 Tax=Schaalia sp. Marseille-Q2122 TaxID=2736604 RepID=UPI0015892D8E|nr:hypothetical protein [Schaalia sp. Marseille-Q2122]